jgi:hypothetical protein
MSRVLTMALRENSWHTAFTAVSCFISFVQPASLCCDEYVYIRTHIYDCVETVYELLLLANNTAGETFLCNSRTVRSVDWMFVIGAPVLRRLGE